MMSYAHPHFQDKAASPSPTHEQPRTSADDVFVLVHEHADQEVSTTASRRTRRADFLRAATWAVTRGLHPRATDTTLRVAGDLAARLNADGHVAYCRDAMFTRLGISRRTLERHIAVLRELGLLVWVVHGTRTNTRPPDSGEWAGTATIYAAVVPRAWDNAVGHRVRGHGYHARHIGFTPRGRGLAIAEARRRTRPPTRRHDTPSCRTNPIRQTAEVEQKENNTCPQRHGRAHTRHPQHVPEPYRARPDQAAHAVTIAAWIRPRVPWTQAEGLRRLAFALRPWITAGLSATDIAAELMAWRVPPRPESPASLMMARWRDLTQRSQTAAAEPGTDQDPVGVPPNQAFLDARNHLRARLQPARPPAEPEPPAFVIRNRILTSLAEAERAWRARTAEECRTYADWEAVCDARERTPW
ncbi:hypothetical protein [Streptomyces sp. NPDC002550]